jgi:hypothetical protein
MLGHSNVERLLGVTYRRALYLLADLKDTKEERLKNTVTALATLREVVTSVRSESTATEIAREIAPALFDEAIERQLTEPLAPMLAGATAALAFLAGLRDSTFLEESISGHLAGAYSDPGDNVAALNGVAVISPELIWRVPELLRAIDALVAGFDEERFVEQLPHLRLAFGALNPNETDEVARLVAARHDADAALQAPVTYGVSEEELAANLALGEKVRVSLRADGLGDWTTP